MQFHFFVKGEKSIIIDYLQLNSSLNRHRINYSIFENNSISNAIFSILKKIKFYSKTLLLLLNKLIIF